LPSSAAGSGHERGQCLAGNRPRLDSGHSEQQQRQCGETRVPRATSHVPLANPGGRQWHAPEGRAHTDRLPSAHARRLACDTRWLVAMMPGASRATPLSGRTSSSIHDSPPYAIRGMPFGTYKYPSVRPSVRGVLGQCSARARKMRTSVLEYVRYMHRARTPPRACTPR
jgi:hypothetical protein